MSPFFTKNPEKAAAKETAKREGPEEVRRLVALQPRELACELLPGLGANGVPRRRQGGVGLGALVLWKMDAYSKYTTGFFGPLQAPFQAAVLQLEQAALVERHPTQGGQELLKASALGEQALAEGAVANYLSR